MKNQKTMGNKGFSLVELIVVIAIMAVLVGVLAPQFIKYVNNSKVSTDIKNGQEIAASISTDLADGKYAASVTTPTELTSTNKPSSIAALPAIKYGSGTKWFAKYDIETGEVHVYIGTSASSVEEVYPTATAYDAHKK